MRSFLNPQTIFASLALCIAMTGCTVIENDGTDTGYDQTGGGYEPNNGADLGNGGNTGGQNGNQNGGGQGNNNDHQDPDTGYDGSTDGDVDGGSITCYPDYDEDGYGDGNWPEEFEGDECPRYFADNGDDWCNGNPDAHTYEDCLATEDTSDDSDDSGYTGSDEGFDITCFPDLDGDGYGNGNYPEEFAGTECPDEWADNGDDWCDGNPDAFDYCGCMPEECE